MTTVRDIANIPFEEIEVGQSAELSITLTKAQIDMLALVSGDVDALHLRGETGRAGADVRQT